ncbi:MAG TPA: hypothetical protein VN628_12205 [Vicinamibacterales bacterium]|nr:hypothetical protein [Vicinamibacterales bacterium]
MFTRSSSTSGQPDREIALVALFGPAIERAREDPRVLLTWEPLARTLRARFSAEFAALDAASGSTFPFSKEFIASAHSRWTADWLAWEQAHDSTYKLKAIQAQHGLGGDTTSELARATLDAVEREKLELYQRRYEDYVRVARSLHDLQ